MEFSADFRPFIWHNSIGKDELLIRKLRAKEGLSTPFELSLTLHGTRGDLVAEDIVGSSATLEVMLPDEDKRYLDGYVVSFERSGMSGSRYVYEAEVRPWVWFGLHNRDSRIFQEMDATAVLKDVLGRMPFAGDVKYDFRESYQPLEYCVQYRESDFGFVSRLMEEYGIYYYFEHEQGNHRIVFTDHGSGHPEVEFQGELEYQRSLGARFGAAVAIGVNERREFVTSKFASRDYEFKAPTDELDVETSDGSGKIGEEKLEDYDYPRRYYKKGLGDQLAKIRLEESVSRRHRIEISTSSRCMAPGYRVALKGHFRDEVDRTYLITRTAWDGQQPLDNDNRESHAYGCTFQGLDEAVPFRPPQTWVRPVVEGPHTAIVTGRSGDEMYVDEHGRIKVHFFWDRHGTKDDKASCWIRVSAPFAGDGYGGFFLPRVGHEVIVSFLEGDPDRPLVTGCVYNGDNPLPFGHQSEPTRNGIKIQSTDGGGADNYNEMSFESTKGKEEIRLQGEKDWNALVKNDKNTTIGNDETLTVEHDRTKSITNDEKSDIGNNRTESVGVDEKVDIGSNRTHTIGADDTQIVQANHSVDVAINRTDKVGANLTENVGANKTETVAIAKALSVGAAYQVSVGAAMNETVALAKSEEVGAARIYVVANDQTETIGGDHSQEVSGKSTFKGKEITLEADTKILLKVGGSKIEITSGSIVIKSSKVAIN